MPVYIEKCGDLVRCHHSGTNKQGKIELLSHWTMEGWDEQFSHWRHEVQIGTSSSGCDQFLTQPNFPSHCISPSSTDCLWLCLCLWLFVCVCACLSVTSEAVTDDKRLRARLATRNWQEDTYSTLPMAKRRQILQIFNKYFSGKVVKIRMYQKWHFDMCLSGRTKLTESEMCWIFCATQPQNW